MDDPYGFHITVGLSIERKYRAGAWLGREDFIVVRVYCHVICGAQFCLGTLNDPQGWLFPMGISPKEQNSLSKRVWGNDLIMDRIQGDLVHGPG